MMIITPFHFSKETSQILKGIAILMMVFLHLFNRDSQIALYESCCMIAGHPLTQLFAKACNPVGIFLFLSGYGLMFSFSKDKGVKCLHLMGGGRVLSLYVALWTTYLIFIPICALLDSSGSYPGDSLTALLNVFAMKSTWNHTTWFVFPFSLILMTYPCWFLLFRTRRLGIVAFLASLVLYYLVAVLYGRFWDAITSYRPLLMLCRYVELLCPFLLGALVFKFADQKFKLPGTSAYMQMVIITVLLLCFSYSTMRGIPVYPIYCGILVLLFANLKYATWVGRLLAFLGKYSMMIWLVHTYFCDVLLQDFIYGFRYQVVIFLVEFFLSLFVAIFIDGLFTKISWAIRNK